jgi:LysM repeat protein
MVSISFAQDKEYRQHRVQVGETIESIAKAYKITPFSILRLNPDAKKGIDTSMVLIIPSTSLLAEEIISERTVTFINYEVQRKETLYTIARNFKISVDDIKKHNPALYTGELRKGSTIKVPQYSKTVLPETGVVNIGGKIVNVNQLNKKVFNDSLIGFKKHKTRKRETLFGISQEYGIAIDSIKKYNNFLYGSALKKGDRLEIPQYIKIENKSPFGDVELVEYIVLPSEGKWRIAYKFDTTIKKLELYNPEMGDALVSGQKILVPNKQVGIGDQIDNNYNYYVVKPAEGFYRLKLKLGLEEEVIKALNPEIEENGGLKSGMILKIPKDTEGDFNVNNLLLTERFNLIDSINKQSVSNLVVMLPFKLNEIDFEIEEDAMKTIKEDRLIPYSSDFYSGVLMALDKAKEIGLSVNLTTYDIEYNNKKLDDILLIKNFDSVDVVIGPFLQRNIDKVAMHLRDKNIPVMSPLIDKVDTYLPNIFQTVPSEEILRSRMMQFLEENGEGKNIIIISDEAHTGIKAQLLEKFPEAKQIDLTKTEKEKEAHDRAKFIELEEATELLDLEKENWVIFETDNEELGVNVTSVFNGLLSAEMKITLLTTFKANFYDTDNIDNTYLANLNFHYPSVDKVVPMNTANEFMSKYREAYNATPSKWAVRGYDLTLDVVLRLAYNKNLALNSYLIGETEYVENKFNYDRRINGGYFNKATYIIKYEGLSIKEVK